MVEAKRFYLFLYLAMKTAYTILKEDFKLNYHRLPVLKKF